MGANLIRSPFFYVGDKFKLIPQLKENFPQDIERFIEPFCGGGSVFLNVKADSYLLNDIDGNIIELHKFLYSYANQQQSFWDELKSYITGYQLSASAFGFSVPDELKKQHIKTYFARYNKEQYIKMREDFNNSRNSFLLYLLLIYGFNRFLRFNANNQFNLPVGNVDFNYKVMYALNDYFNYTKNKSIEYSSLDFQVFLDKVKPNKKDLLYLDPPYLISNSEYNKLWNEEHELRLINYLDELNNKGVRFAISNVLWHRNRYNGTFNHWAKKYNLIKIKSNYISYHDNTVKDSVEVLVKNY
jgi:DNA adenine methylase